MLKLAWSIGHDTYHRGAFSRHLQESEHFIAEEVVNKGVEIIHRMNLPIDVFTPYVIEPELYSARGVLSRKIKQINSWGADIAIESHFNSSINPKAQGCETLYFSSPNNIGRFSIEGKDLAQEIQKHTIKNLNKQDRQVKDRGAKGMASLKRVYNGVETIPRYMFLMKTKMPAIITEPLFISSENDCRYLRQIDTPSREEEITRIAMSVVAGILSWRPDLKR